MDGGQPFINEDSFSCVVAASSSDLRNPLGLKVNCCADDVAVHDSDVVTISQFPKLWRKEIHEGDFCELLHMFRYKTLQSYEFRNRSHYSTFSALPCFANVRVKNIKNKKTLGHF